MISEALILAQISLTNRLIELYLAQRDQQYVEVPSELQDSVSNREQFAEQVGQRRLARSRAVQQFEKLVPENSRVVDQNLVPDRSFQEAINEFNTQYRQGDS